MIITTNVTMSVPMSLKQEMDEFVRTYPETNWSLVFREAIQSYMLARKTPVPKVEVFLDSVMQDLSMEMGPGIRTTLRVENRMPIPITVDRILVTTTLTSGQTIIVGREAAHLRPLHVMANSSVATHDFFPMSPSDLLRTASLVKQSVAVRENIEAYIQGFREPARANLTGKIPVDEWEVYMKNVRAVFGPKDGLP